MDNKYYQSLQDILQSIVRINVFMTTISSFSDYNSNVLVQQAVERNFEIIGEAIKRLLIIKPEISISETRKIINLRNKISHGYDEIENEQIWGVIVKNLPVLKAEVAALLNK